MNEPRSVLEPAATSPDQALDVTPDIQGGAGAPAVPLDLPPALSARDRRRVGGGIVATDRVNRAVLAVAGVVVAAAGVLVLLLGAGTLQWSETPASLYRSAAGDAAGAATVSAAVATAACLVLALVGLRWALAQLRPVTDGPRLGVVQLGDGERGRTTVPAAAVAKAAGADLASRHGVTSARVRLVALHPVPRAVVVVEMAVDADPGEVGHEIGDALGSLARSLGAPTVDADLRIRFGRPLGAGGASRVH